MIGNIFQSIKHAIEFQKIMPSNYKPLIGEIGILVATPSNHSVVGNSTNV